MYLCCCYYQVGWPTNRFNESFSNNYKSEALEWPSFIRYESLEYIYFNVPLYSDIMYKLYMLLSINPSCNHMLCCCPCKKNLFDLAWENMVIRSLNEAEWMKCIMQRYSIQYLTSCFLIDTSMNHTQQERNKRAKHKQLQNATLYVIEESVLWASTLHKNSEWMV